MIDRAHASGLRVNFCEADDPAFAKELFDMGVDCVLTGDFHRVKSGLDSLKP